MRRPERVLLGGDDAERTVAVARRLRDAGVEVVHTGLTDPAELAEACLQEDVDAVWPPVVGLAEALAERGLDDVTVLVDPVPWLDARDQAAGGLHPPPGGVRG